MPTSATLVISGLEEPDRRRYVYRHYDGYPSGILPGIRRGLHLARKQSENDKWKCVDANYMASLIIATDPLGFHADDMILENSQYVYGVEGRVLDGVVTWEVQVYSGYEWGGDWKSKATWILDLHDVSDLAYWDVKDSGGGCRYPGEDGLDTWHVDFMTTRLHRRSGFLDEGSAMEAAKKLDGTVIRTHFRAEILGRYKGGEWIAGE